VLQRVVVKADSLGLGDVDMLPATCSVSQGLQLGMCRAVKVFHTSWGRFGQPRTRFYKRLRPDKDLQTSLAVQSSGKKSTAVQAVAGLPRSNQAT